MTSDWYVTLMAGILSSRSFVLRSKYFDTPIRPDHNTLYCANTVTRYICRYPEISRYPVADALYGVHLSDNGIEVSRNERPLFSADAPVEIKQVEFSGNRVKGALRAAKEVQFRIGNGRPQKFNPGTSRFEAPLS